MKDVPPATLAALRRLPGTRATVYLILEEDEYETKFGDGLFHYPKEAFLDEAAASARRKELATKGRIYHLKVVEIEREESKNRIVADLRKQPHEKFTLADVVRLLASAGAP